MHYLETLSNILRTKIFIGSEFLTWLWFYTESREMPIDIPILETNDTILISAWIDDKVVLESHISQVHSNTLKGGTPSQSPEAMIALQTGKLVRQIRLGVAVEEGEEFLCTLDDKDLAPRSLKLPDINDKDDENQSCHIDIRLRQIEKFSDILDSLFSLFMEERSQKKWAEEGQKQILHWIASKEQPKSLIPH